jgi:hypothetical protein
MNMKLGLVSALALIAATPAAAQDIAMQPFPVDHEVRVDSEADARFLLDGPAGKYGFIEARDGHLYRPDGKRFRCWGVNLTGWTVGGEEIPSHKDAETYAAALARLGVNCVRMHFLDRPDTENKVRNEGADRGPNAGPFTHGPRGLIRGDVDNSRELNPERLDRLDYWFAELKKNGIYVNFNLNVGRVFKPGDGVPDADLIGNAKA